MVEVVLIILLQLIGFCIKADEIWLMSDVDGLMTADPKIVTNAKLLKEVSYIEAIEMALFGAQADTSANI